MVRELVVAAMAGSSLGLISSAHCAVMCGPISMATRARGGAAAPARYFVGRLVSYTLLGALAGSIGRALASLPNAIWVEAALSWLMALALLMTALKQLGAVRRPALVSLGTGPRKSPVARMLAAVAEDPLLLGALTALLPCGALFAAATAAAALGSAAQGAVSMASFALVSGLALVGVAQLGRIKQWGLAGRRVLGVALLVGAGLLVWRPIPTLRAGDGVPACHRAGEAP